MITSLRIIKISILTLIASLLIQPVFANNLIENTAIIALKNAKHSATGKTFEHGGMIIRHEDETGTTIKYLEPFPNGKFDGVQVIDFNQIPTGDKLVGTFHTHLCMEGYYHDLFSIADVMSAYFSHVPEFMLDECTGEIHEYDPNIDQVRDTRRVVHLFGPECEKVDKYLPTGRIVGNIGEKETMKAPAEDVECKKRSEQKRELDSTPKP
jgi:hypothetical protein